PLMGVAGSAWQIVGLRAADRIGKGLRTPPRDAMIADSAPPAIRGRAFGIQRAMDQLGAAVGPLVAYGILRLWPGQWSYVFLATLVPGAIVVVLVLFGLREKKPSTQLASPSLRLTLAPFAAPFKFYLVVLVIFTLGNTSDLFLLARCSEVGIQDIWIPIL